MRKLMLVAAFAAFAMAPIFAVEAFANETPAAASEKTAKSVGSTKTVAPVAAEAATK